MFLHLGDNVLAPLHELISIIDLDQNSSQINAEFLKTAEEEGFVVQLTQEPVSIVICAKRVYLSSISAQTLHKRAEKGYFAGAEIQI